MSTLLRRLMLTVVVVLGAVGMVIWLASFMADQSPDAPQRLVGEDLVGTIANIVGLVGAVAVVIELAASLMRLRSRRGLEVRISDLVAHGAADRESKAANLEELRLAEYRASRDMAEAAIAPYLPANPRRAKRLLNHERLYSIIAEDRGVFGGQPAITHQHLAKWVLIVEHWSRLGAALTREPQYMRQLEQAPHADSLGMYMDSLAPGSGGREELFEILRSGPPLHPILSRLVRFESSAAAEPVLPSPPPEQADRGVADGLADGLVVRPHS